MNAIIKSESRSALVRAQQATNQQTTDLSEQIYYSSTSWIFFFLASWHSHREKRKFFFVRLNKFIISLEPNPPKNPNYYLVSFELESALQVLRPCHFYYRNLTKNFSQTFCNYLYESPTTIFCFFRMQKISSGEKRQARQQPKIRCL